MSQDGWHVDQQEWMDWYWDLVAHADRHIVVVAPGTLAGAPVTAFFGADLDRKGIRLATNPDRRVRAAQAIGVLTTFQRYCRKSWGMTPPRSPVR